MLQREQFCQNGSSGPYLPKPVPGLATGLDDLNSIPVYFVGEQPFASLVV